MIVKVMILQKQANYYQHHICIIRQLSVHTTHHRFHTATHMKEMWAHKHEISTQHQYIVLR